MFYSRGIKVSRRRIALFVGDSICIAVSIVVAAILRLGSEDAFHYIGQHLPSLGGSFMIFLVVFYAGGMYERQAVTRRHASYALTFILTAIGLTLIILIFYARMQFHIGRGVLVLAGILVFISTAGLRRLYRVAAGHGFLSKNTLVVGEGQSAEEVIHLLARMEDPGFRLFGVVSCTTAKPGEFLEGIPILGHLDKLREFADVYAIESIIVATSLAREHSVLRVLRPLRYSGVEILDYAGLYEGLAQEIPVEHIDDEWLMHAAMNSSRIHIRKIKRIMDLFVAVAGLVLSAPVSLIAAMLIKLDSSGPVIFRQRRSGLDGQDYVLMKFRTMRHNAEADSGAVWAGKFDSRVTRVGKFLRKWRIDEIPQLVNVLRGEMSLVGPRPERPEFVETLSSTIPFYKERLLVAPGITGWAQVNYPYAASVDASRRKLQFDLYYIKHMSFFLDCITLLRTFRTIIEGIRYGEDLEESSERVVDKKLHVLQSETDGSSSKTA